jgi:dihydropteroate synthase
MQKRIFKARSHRFDLSKRPLIMGVLNITPDSFSDGGRYTSVKKACQRALEIQSQGADIIDIGGESTRPGALPVSIGDELKRVIPVIKAIRKKLGIPISIDTTKFEVAREAFRHGACILNDISGLQADKRLAGLCAKNHAAVIIMHKKGSPCNMQKNPAYKDLLKEITAYLRQGIRTALSEGIGKNSIVIDPGIGFGKNLKHNLTIIKNIGYFKKTGFPVLIGLSRKSFLGSMTALCVQERIIPTIAANAITLYNGADILRVHDVREAIITLKTVNSIRKC